MERNVSDKNAGEELFDRIDKVDLSEEGNSSGRKEKKKSKKKPILVSVIVTLILALGASFSWYLFSKENHADTKDIEIMTPYFLYLLNPDDRTSLQFAVGNIHPGETKRILICVSNKRPEDTTEDAIDIARESNFNYDLEFLYTENLAVNYRIYEMQKFLEENGDPVPEDAIEIENIPNVYWTKAAADGETNAEPLTMTSDVTDARRDEVFGTANLGNVINKGRYELYKQDRNGKDLHLAYEENKYEFDYYMIEISWKDNIKFADYTKETDLLYVVVNAKQPKPISIGA